MIDKPKGKIEHFIEEALKWFREFAGEFKEVFSAGMEPINAGKKAHPRLARVVAAAALICVCGLVVVGFTTPKTVIVKIDDSRKITTSIYETTSTRVDSFIENHNIDYVYGQDIINAELYDGITDEMTISIVKAYDVTVRADGQETKVRTLPTTAGDILDLLEITLDEMDIVEPELTEKVRDGDVITVNRVTKKQVKEKVTTDFEVRYAADSSLVIGETKVSQKGRKGIQEKTYEITMVDGREVKKTLIESEVIKKKKDKIISYGTKILSGKPAGLKYKQKYTNVRTVSYHFSGNPRGAYGLPCEYGTCAVDKELIPLGSLLYIEGYGYAVANDVGSAIKGKTVDVYMERAAQCGIWGARKTTVYVIE
ncbi:MAG: G5 domain-containing protein [Firmicutes bacterium]|nr:G5 domain-containing protein [Bacillota bacterium]